MKQAELHKSQAHWELSRYSTSPKYTPNVQNAREAREEIGAFVVKAVNRSFAFISIFNLGTSTTSDSEHANFASLAFPAPLNSLPNSLDVFTFVLLVEVARFHVGRTCSIRVVQQALYTRQDSGNIIRRAPPILQDIQA